MNINLPKIIGHRGVKDLAPENTIASLEESMRHNLKWIEVDVKVSKDNIPFLLHDDFLDRTTSGKGYPYNYLYKEIFRLDAGSWFNKKFSNVYPPTLEEVLIWIYNHLNPGGSAVFRIHSVFSHIGADLGNDTKVPIPHLLFPRHIIDDFLQETSGSSSRYTSPMSSSSYLMLFHRVGFEIIDVVKLSGGIKDKDTYAMFQDKLWFYSKDELNSGGIIVHLKKPIIERDISELEV